MMALHLNNVLSALAKSKTRPQFLFSPCVVDESYIINGDLPVKIAFCERLDNAGEVVFVGIAKADGDVGHPVRGVVVVRDAGTSRGDFGPERLLERGQFRAAYNWNIQNWMRSIKNTQARCLRLESCLIQREALQDRLELF